MFVSPIWGMDPDTTNEIAKEVDVIINSAGNTNFDERYVGLCGA